MKSVEHRLSDAEEALQIGDPGDCHCGYPPLVMQGDDTGERPDEWRSMGQDASEICPECGRPRLTIRISYDRPPTPDEETT